MIASGTGLGRYVESLAGTGSDAVLSPTGSLQSLETVAAVVGYVHYWRDDLLSGASYAIVEVWNSAIQPSTAIKRTESARVNLIWRPVPLVEVGVEYLWGRRTNADDATGHANRIQFSVKYKLN